jgi:hypothetical protein
MGARMKIRYSCVFLILVFSSNTWALDFKGIELGAPATKEEITRKLGIKCGSGTNHLFVCNGISTVAGAKAFINVTVGKSGNVSRILIDFKEANFPEVANAMIKKFGPPIDKETDTLQNAMGAKYKQEKLTWMEGENHAVLKRYAGKISDSSIYMSTEEDRAMLRQLNKADESDI